MYKFSLCLAIIAVSAVADAFSPEFFVFRNGLSFGPPAQEAAVVKELGYAGVSQVKGDKLAERVAAYEAVGLRVLSIYLNVDDKPISAAQVKPLANRGAMIELTVRKTTPATEQAVRETVEMAAGLGIKVTLYPHAGFAVATMSQAIALAEKIDHPNLGVTFNLCHFLKSEAPTTLEPILKQAGKRLLFVSTNGADTHGKNWNTLIQPLDKGDFPQTRLFTALKAQGYSGTVGLQCYAVKGDKKDNLARSMAAWQSIMATVNSGRP
jgi:sugar phosphate isomerase/epimerase